MRLRTADARQAKPQRGFILTDPPYWSREGRKVAIDDWLKPAFAENYRGLTHSRRCVKFFGSLVRANVDLGNCSIAQTLSFPRRRRPSSIMSASLISMPSARSANMMTCRTDTMSWAARILMAIQA